MEGPVQRECSQLMRDIPTLLSWNSPGQSRGELMLLVFVVDVVQNTLSSPDTSDAGCASLKAIFSFHYSQAHIDGAFHCSGL